jgi:hypothetical protein
MVAVQELIPDHRGDAGYESVMAVLRDHPTLAAQIAAVTEYAERAYPGATAVLEAKQYDEWDPPLMLTITIPSVSIDAYLDDFGSFYRWLDAEARRVDESLVGIFPAYGGPVDEDAGE